MFAFTMIGVNDLSLSEKFYDDILLPLNIIKTLKTERYIGYSKKNTPEIIKFYITKPFNKDVATNGNGTMIAFLAESQEVVNKFHEISLKKGAVNEGSPGPRNDLDYYAYIRDVDGNKICAFTQIS